MDVSKKKAWGLEEKILVVPVILALLATIGGFLAGFVGEGAAEFCNLLSYYLFAWVVAIGTSLGFREGTHMQIRVILNLLPAGIRKGLQALIEIINLAVVALFFVFSFQVFVSKIVGGAEETSDILTIFVYFAPIIGFAMSTVREVVRIMKGGKEE